MRKVKVEIKRVCYFIGEKELTDEEYEQLKEMEGFDAHGMDVADIMSMDLCGEPDRWEDELEIIDDEAKGGL